MSLTWNLQTLPATRAWKGLAWNGSVFAALYGFSSQGIATSPDGAIWTARATALPSSSSWSMIRAGNGLFLAIVSGATTAATSPDGVTWTSRTISSSGTWNDAIWDGSQFVVIGTRVARSADGSSWTSALLGWTGVSLAYNGSVYCATTGSGQVWTSPDTVTWTSHAVTGTWSGIAWNGSVFCMVQNGTDVSATSPDGVTWTTTGVLPASQAWKRVVWTGEVFVAIGSGSNDVSAWSEDGLTWTSATLPVASNWWDLAWAPEINTLGAISQTSGTIFASGTPPVLTVPPANEFWTGFVNTEEVI